MKTTNNRHSLLICLSAVLAFAAYSSPLRADTTIWTGATGDDWFNPANWSLGVPTPSKDAVINNGGKAAIYTPGATARTLTLGANPGDSGAVVVDGTNGGALFVPPACGGTPDPNFIGVGIYVGYGGSGNLSILNGGTVASGYGYIGLLSSDGTHRASNGAVTIAGAGSAWTLSGCPGDARLGVGGNNTSNPGGTALLSVTNGGAVTVNNLSGGLTSLSVGISGTLTAAGVITLNGDGYFSRLAVVNGTLAPSGTLAIVGHLALTISTTTLYNVTPQISDFIGVKKPGNVGGTAKLNGRLSVIMDGTFTPTVTRYTLLEAQGGLDPTSNRFGSVSIKYPTDQHFTPQITYDTNHVYLDLDFTIHNP